MSKTVKRFMNFQFNHYTDLQQQLEKYAKEGLFLEKHGTFFWKFRRGEPKNTAYTVTYFPEGSMFNPHPTENQLTYYEYAQQSGWEFVTEINQMQIFCSDKPNPTPFDTDHGAKLANIKKCMRKSFLPSTIAIIVVFLLNIIIQITSLERTPIEFLSSYTRLFPLAVIVPVTIQHICILIGYISWCVKSTRSVMQGGKCIEKTHKLQRTVKVILMIYTLSVLLAFIIGMVSGGDSFIMLLGMAQTPLLILIFGGAIRLMRRAKASATANRVVAYTLLIAVSFGYMFLVGLFIVSNLGENQDAEEYRLVEHQLTDTVSQEYRLYSHDIPLTCQDIYGQDDYEFYSYEAHSTQTVFMSYENYSQSGLPAKDSPPKVSYDITRPKSKLMYDIATHDVLTPNYWFDGTMAEIDPQPFYATKAYKLLNIDGDHFGDYTLFYEDKIVELYLEEVPTQKQMQIIGEILRES